LFPAQIRRSPTSNALVQPRLYFTFLRFQHNQTKYKSNTTE
jgi:hypothetical protein